MPVVPVQSDDWSELVAVVGRLCLNPASFEATEHLEKAWGGFALYGALKYFGGEAFTLTQENLDILGAGKPDRVPLGLVAQELAYGLLTAGHVLVYTLRLKRHLPRLASAESAFKIVSMRYAAAKSPASLTYIKTAWRKYRPVAHFVGAIDQAHQEVASLRGIFPEPDWPMDNSTEVALGSDYFGKIKDNLQRISQEFKATSPVLARYFGFAEELRRQGEAHFAPNQERKGRPLLDPETTWSMPPQFQLTYSPLILPDLDAAERQSAAGVN